MSAGPVGRSAAGIGAAAAKTALARAGFVSGAPVAPAGGLRAPHAANMGLLDFGLGRLRTPNGVVNAL